MIPSSGCVHHHFPIVEYSRGDLFSVKENKKCFFLCSLAGHSPGSVPDTFLLNFPKGLLYAFPQVLFLPKVLYKIKQDGDYIILIAPAWALQTLAFIA